MKSLVASLLLLSLVCFASAYEGRRSLVTRFHRLRCTVPWTCSRRINATTTPAEKDLFMRGHNDFRSAIAKGGVSLSNLTWNNDLAAYAYDWVKFLQNKACNDTFENLNNTEVANFTTGTVGTPQSVYLRNGTRVVVGENLIYSQLSQYARADRSRFFRRDWPYRTVAYWHNSQKFNYDFNNRTCSTPGACDQYLQVVSNFSRLVGCAYSDCKFAFNQRQIQKANVTFRIAFCNYFPEGVFEGVNPY